MKVCSPPVDFAEPDYSNYDSDVERDREEAHKAEIVKWLKANGYTGPLTGEIFSTPRADGYANYMYADAPAPHARRSMLIHLPYGDGWHDPHVEYLPKKAIFQGIERSKGLAKLFAPKKAD